MMHKNFFTYARIDDTRTNLNNIQRVVITAGFRIGVDVGRVC